MNKITFCCTGLMIATFGFSNLYAQNYNGFSPEEVQSMHQKWTLDNWDDGDFYKGGFGGQGLYILPSQNIVITFFGTADESGVRNQLDDISRQIAKSGLFD